jgi:hypothetical protein
MTKEQFSDLENTLKGRFAGLVGEKKYRVAGKEIAVKESMAAGGSYVVQFANGSTFTIPSVKSNVDDMLYLIVWNIGSSYIGCC